MKLKLNLDVKKGSEAVSDALHKTSEFGKKVSSEVQKTAKEITEKTKNENYLRKLKKYNPLFPDKYFGNDFNIPNMIVIVDDAERRDIDVCDGAIGWTSNQNGMEVLHLYDEFINDCGIQFIPAPICDSIYYVDRFDRTRFIQTDCIFSKAHEERLAELQNIAYSLGAKSCSIEIIESIIEKTSNKTTSAIGGNGIINGFNANSSAKSEQKSSYKGQSQRMGKLDVQFVGSEDVKIPELKWFAYDNNIKNLIEMRCNSTNSIKNQTLILEGAVSATMSKKTATNIDSAINKMGIKGKCDMEGQAITENHSKLIFDIIF
ncbi:MAG: hypothetical protein IJ447_09545 [Clostridia bacterium]|nr:hypothetical protein [Clostridia bacterium]